MKLQLQLPRHPAVSDAAHAAAEAELERVMRPVLDECEQCDPDSCPDHGEHELWVARRLATAEEMAGGYALRLTLEGVE